MALPDEFHDVARRVNNWGRWGPDDQRGTLNLLTDDVVARAASEVRTGQRIGLALPLSPDGVQAGLVPGRENPVHTMTRVHEAMTGDPSDVCDSDGTLLVGLQSSTHWDALSHVSYDGRLYNGNDLAVVGPDGATSLGIEHAGPVAGRGVLLDIAGLKEVDRLHPGYAITPDDLDAACERQGVEVVTGDIVLVRTGQIRHFLEDGDRIAYAFPSAGLTIGTAIWFHEHDVAAVATDNLTCEVFPGEREDMILPVHLLHLVEMGLTQGQNWNLEELAAACAEDERWTFFLSAPPEPVVGATGAPVAPVAIR
jgi:kynurenine formamidase